MLSNLQVCFNAVMPLFLIMGLGYGVKCLGGIRVEDVPGLNKMAFRFFMPVMLFWNLYTSSIDQALQPKLLLFAVGATLVMYGLSLAIVLPTEIPGTPVDDTAFHLVVAAQQGEGGVMVQPLQVADGFLRELLGHLRRQIDVGAGDHEVLPHQQAARS